MPATLTRFYVLYVFDNEHCMEWLEYGRFEDVSDARAEHRYLRSQGQQPRITIEWHAV